MFFFVLRYSPFLTRFPHECFRCCCCCYCCWREKKSHLYTHKTSFSERRQSEGILFDVAKTHTHACTLGMRSVVVQLYALVELRHRRHKPKWTLFFSYTQTHNRILTFFRQGKVCAFVASATVDDAVNLLPSCSFYWRKIDRLDRLFGSTINSLFGYPQHTICSSQCTNGFDLRSGIFWPFSWPFSTII